ncbi:MAG: TetR/AcrR family transcriptional regulator [Solobacterium sp.]|nr:TetR/AcrR family transcriptional regulator [Solobacterium sp.]
MRDRKFSAAQLIRNAFFSLLAEKPYIDITVSDIARKAEVARASFYRNFHSVSDVLESILSDFTGRLREIISSLPESPADSSWQGFLDEYISFRVQVEDTVLGIRSDNLSLILQKLMIQAQDLRRETAGSSGDRYRTSALISMINGVIDTWSQLGRKESRQEIITYLMTLVSQF